ncbi:MAG: (2Fe-2S) ferredoxin domain-containing protein [Prochloraceae cyanobacterium]|nr:(2Fe-2S) ferredoxin domain-containing protein [Prochloraceae cyanobacterium]
MSKLKEKVSDFNEVGQLLGFVIKDGYKIKYLRVTVSDKEYWIKLPKELRNSLDRNIVPGSWLEISGEQKLCLKTGKLKLKACEVKLARAKSDSCQTSPCAGKDRPLSTPCQKSKASILVCQKSSCWKRGGRAICEALESGLRDRGLEEKVKIKTTGCLKKCKMGPNVVMMPDKARYSKIMPKQVPDLLEKHFLSTGK